MSHSQSSDESDIDQLDHMNSTQQQIRSLVWGNEASAKKNLILNQNQEGNSSSDSDIVILAQSSSRVYNYLLSSTDNSENEDTTVVKGQNSESKKELMTNRAENQIQESKASNHEAGNIYCISSDPEDCAESPKKDKNEVPAVELALQQESLTKKPDLNKESINNDTDLEQSRKKYIDSIIAAILSTGKTHISGTDLAVIFKNDYGLDLFQEFKKLQLASPLNLENESNGKLQVKKENGEYYFATFNIDGYNRVLFDIIRKENAEEAAWLKEQEKKRNPHQSYTNLCAPNLDSANKATQLNNCVVSDKSTEDQFFDSNEKQSNADLPVAKPVTSPQHQEPVKVVSPSLPNQEIAKFVTPQSQKLFISSSDSEQEDNEELPTIVQKPVVLKSPSVVLPHQDHAILSSDSEQENIEKLPTSSITQKHFISKPSSVVSSHQNHAISSCDSDHQKDNNELPTTIQKSVTSKPPSVVLPRQTHSISSSNSEQEDNKELPTKKETNNPAFVSSTQSKLDQKESSISIKQPSSIPQFDENPLRQEFVTFLNDALSKQSQVPLSWLRKQFELKIGQLLGHEMCKKIFGFQAKTLRHAIDSLEQFRVRKLNGVAFVILNEDYIPTDDNEQSDYLLTDDAE